MKDKGSQPYSIYTLARMPGLLINYEARIPLSYIPSLSKYSSTKATDRRRISRANGLYSVYLWISLHTFTV